MEGGAVTRECMRIERSPSWRFRRVSGRPPSCPFEDSGRVRGRYGPKGGVSRYLRAPTRWTPPRGMREEPSFPPFPRGESAECRNPTSARMANLTPWISVRAHGAENADRDCEGRGVLCRPPREEGLIVCSAGTPGPGVPESDRTGARLQRQSDSPAYPEGSRQSGEPQPFRTANESTGSAG